MIGWLYILPDWALLAFWAGLLAGLMVVLPFLMHRIPWLRPNPENSDFVLRLQATLFTITSVVVAFTPDRGRGQRASRCVLPAARAISSATTERA